MHLQSWCSLGPRPLSKILILCLTLAGFGICQVNINSFMFYMCLISQWWTLTLSDSNSHFLSFGFINCLPIKSFAIPTFKESGRWQFFYDKVWTGKAVFFEWTSNTSNRIKWRSGGMDPCNWTIEVSRSTLNEWCWGESTCFLLLFLWYQYFWRTKRPGTWIVGRTQYEQALQLV